MLFFFLENIFDQVARDRIIVAQPPDDLRVGFNGDSLRDQIFADHLDERTALNVFRMAAGADCLAVNVTTVVALPLALEVGGVVIVMRYDAQDDAATFQVGFVKLCPLFGNAPADQRANVPG